MATIQDLKTKLLNVNALGRTNLSEKGVALPETATTYDIMSKIAEISGGGGVTYTSIVYNTDNTVTLTDTDGIVHTMSCTYADGKLIGVTYDGKAVELTYNGDALVKVGKTAVDVANAPATSGATLNIAYGETAPEDTSKLWIKANEPANVSVGSDFEGVGSIANVGYLPSVEYGMSTARVGNKIYLFGGKTKVNSDITYLNTIRVYDIETNTLTTLETTLPTPCEEMGCASVGTKIYLFGGKYYTGSWHYVNTINVFDTETNTLTTLSTTTPTSTNKYYSMGCVANGTKIYLFGGSDQNSIINTINVFDIKTETFATLSTTLPQPNYSMGCTSVGAKIYLFGGWTNSIGYLNTISVFDVNTNTITTLNTTLPQALHMESCASIGTKIYLFGGYNGTVQNAIYEFDTETEEVITLDAILSTACYSMGCSAYGNKVYLFGGYGSSALNTINCFTLTHELTQGNIELQSGLFKNKFNLINTENAQIKVGVEKVYIGNTKNEAELCEAYLYNGTEWVVI